MKSNRAALGAVVPLEQGADKHEQEVRSGDGSISQSDLRLHFGIGKSRTAQKIVIRWPSGLVETLSDLPANHYYIVREGNGVDQSKMHGVSSVRANASRAEITNWRAMIEEQRVRPVSVQAFHSATNWREDPGRRFRVPPHPRLQI